MQAAVRRGSADVCRCLLSAGADPDRRDQLSGDTALHAAARAGHTAVIRLLLDSGADTEITDCHGATALAVAAQVSQLLSAKHYQPAAIVTMGWCIDEKSAELVNETTFSTKLLQV